MSLDFNNYINIERHRSKMEHKAQEVRTKYASRPSEPKRYLLDLFDFFLNDIKKVAKNIFSEILHEKDKLGDKFNFTSTDLKECIENGTRCMLHFYDRIISSYNAGNMFREVDDFIRLKASFKEDAEALCKRQSESFEIEHLKNLEEHRLKYETHFYAKLGGIAAVVAILIAVLPIKIFEKIIQTFCLIFQ